MGWAPLPDMMRFKNQRNFVRKVLAEETGRVSVGYDRVPGGGAEADK